MNLKIISSKESLKDVIEWSLRFRRIYFSGISKEIAAAWKE